MFVDAAIVPLASVKPKVKLNVLASILIGLLGGLGLAFLMEMLDTSIKSEEDVENIVGVPLLGVIPQVKPGLSEESNRDVVLYSYTNPKSSLAESVRSLRTNIHFLSPDNPVTKMLVTSAGPREGKTTVASSLSISLAQTGKRTLIIDTDLRKPRAHKVFGLSKQSGYYQRCCGRHPGGRGHYPHRNTRPGHAAQWSRHAHTGRAYRFGKLCPDGGINLKACIPTCCSIVLRWEPWPMP